MSLRTLITIALLSCLGHLAGCCAFFLLARSLGLDSSVLSIGWVRSTVILATMIPISVSGLGLREGALLALATYYGAGPNQAMAYSLLVFAVTVVAIGLLGGLIEAWHYTRSLRRRA